MSTKHLSEILMTSAKTFILVASLLIVGLLSSCDGPTPNNPPISSCISFRIVNLTPDVVPTDELHVQVRRVETGQYHDLSEYQKGNEIVLRIGKRMSPTPQPPVQDPAPWSHQRETFEADILVSRGDKLVGTIRAQMETTEYNYNKVTRLISYTGFKSVELFLPPHQKVDSEQFWYYTTFRVKF